MASGGSTAQVMQHCTTGMHTGAKPLAGHDAHIVEWVGIRFIRVGHQGLLRVQCRVHLGFTATLVFPKP